MLEKPLEWRRFEPVELEGDVARSAPRATGVASVSNTPSLLHEFERVLRENERLQLEVSTLRAEAARSRNGTTKFREELESARAELAELEGESIPPRDLRQNTQHAEARTRPGGEEQISAESEMLKKISTVVAGYIFANPTEVNIRLVEDALCARGLVQGLRQKNTF